MADGVSGGLRFPVMAGRAQDSGVTQYHLVRGKARGRMAQIAESGARVRAPTGDKPAPRRFIHVLESLRPGIAASDHPSGQLAHPLLSSQRSYPLDEIERRQLDNEPSAPTGSTPGSATQPWSPFDAAICDGLDSDGLAILALPSADNGHQPELS